MILLSIASNQPTWASNPPPPASNQSSQASNQPSHVLTHPSCLQINPLKPPTHLARPQISPLSPLVILYTQHLCSLWAIDPQPRTSKQPPVLQHYTSFGEVGPASSRLLRSCLKTRISIQNIEKESKNWNMIRVTDSKTNRQTDRQTGKQTDRQIDRWADIHITTPKQIWGAKEVSKVKIRL